MPLSFIFHLNGDLKMFKIHSKQCTLNKLGG
ncbi:hypothetical protein JOD45_002430 [Scopulibacillus daqui]|uniref:Uncharacterized protein n=1 Tax=Scopulibacillus daqui TaxID=1469162 RepID=A0ABS2Q3F2_9BACL|nr:hypothetical protein [Scopulibacillus daqui]